MSRSSTFRRDLGWLTVSLAVLLVLLAVAPFCSAAPARTTHRQPTVRPSAGPSREVAEVGCGVAIAPPPLCGALDRPAAAGWLASPAEPGFHSLLAFHSLQSRAPPAR